MKISQKSAKTFEMINVSDEEVNNLLKQMANLWGKEDQKNKFGFQ